MERDVELTEQLVDPFFSVWCVDQQLLLVPVPGGSLL